MLGKSLTVCDVDEALKIRFDVAVLSFDVFLFDDDKFVMIVSVFFLPANCCGLIKTAKIQVSLFRFVGTFPFCPFLCSALFVCKYSLIR